LPSLINFKLSSFNLYEILRDILTSMGKGETSPVRSGGEKGYTDLCGEGWNISCEKWRGEGLY
jgi:hypothetical protein